MTRLVVLMPLALPSLLVLGCNEVVRSSADAALPPDAVPDVTPSDAPVVDASCKTIHARDPALPSGAYTIDPDGPGGDAALEVTCDMSLAGGGWTVVFFPSTSALAAPPEYTSSTPRLLADAQEALLAYRSASQVAYTNFATLDLPADWRAMAPFSYSAVDVTTGVSINGGPRASAVLRYGKSQFANLCSDAWVTTDDYGRVCIVDTLAPFFVAFAIAGGDLCNKSTEGFGTTPCSNDLRFSIAVR